MTSATEAQTDLTAQLTAFIDRYRGDIVAFVREVLHAEPWPWQLEVLAEYQKRNRRISIRSGHRVGKTTCLAWMILHHAMCFFPQKVQVTAPTEKQLYNALWAEVKKWHHAFKAQVPELAALLDIKHDSMVFLPAPGLSFTTCATSRAETPEALSGIHSDWVLLIGDEASGIPEQVFEAAVGSMAGKNAITILAGNPVRGQGMFFETHGKLKGDGTKGTWWTRCVPCAEVPEQVTADYAEDVAMRYGVNSNVYRVRVLGEFPVSDDDTVIPFDKVEPSAGRDVTTAPTTQIIWGVDCARFGRDRSTLCKRQANRLKEPIRAWYKLDTMELAGRVKLEWDEAPSSERPAEICVDANGLGAGVADRLRQLGLPVRCINVSESPTSKDQDRYQRLRDELWFKMRAWFYALDCTIPDEYLDPRYSGGDLIGELTKPKYKFLPNGKIKVESKDDLKARGVDSPDLAEALLMTFASESITLAFGSERSTSWNEPLDGPDTGVV